MKPKHNILSILLFLACILFSFTLYAQSGRISIDLSGRGWKLWYDKEANWKSESLVMPPLDVRTLPVAIPSSGWNVFSTNDALEVKVPGTAEEYLQTISGPEGDIHGVSWWSRMIQIPSFNKGMKVYLKFESIRSRAEIFINRQLVDYQIVDNTPFEVDITPYVQKGTTAELAVRITDAGGNYDWRDGALITWGDKTLPPGHAFGGITGKVCMEVRPAVHVADIYMQNTPEVTTVNAIVSIDNQLNRVDKRDVLFTIYEWNNPSQILFKKKLKSVDLSSGLNNVKLSIAAPAAKLWDIDQPNLYVCKVELLGNKNHRDVAEQRFGFRWFEASGIGQNAVFRLNGKRIVLRSAISWGFWPVNGIYPSDELAERQIRIAKELGLNMLNFHRFIGSTNILNYADELGLLYFEEPGGFRVKAGNDFLNKNLHEKVMRMVRRDRSHPSLVIYNMMNESGNASPEQLAIEINTMKDVHKMDPSRYVLRTSAWAKGYDIDDQAKIHIRPNDTTVYWNGWYDYHHAGGPAVWNEALYKSPANYYNNTTNAKEIVFFGEEGALSAPPRLAKNKEELDKMEYKGWDGREYLRWYDEFDRFIDNKGLRQVYPSVDSLTVAMGAVSFEHQGRKIELARINNYTDAYVVNGWESELIENYSGIVDCFRYPKSNPSIIERYNKPLYVAVKPRQQIVKAGETVVTDFYLINENDVKGHFVLSINLQSVAGGVCTETNRQVKVIGGETYGQLIADSVCLKLPSVGGLCRISARLLNEDGTSVTTGYDEVLVVDLSTNKLEGKGAVWEDGTAMASFLKGRTAQPVEKYRDDLGKLDWVLVTRPPRKEQLTMIPSESLRTPQGEHGLEAVYYMDMDFQQEVHRETSKVVNLSAIEGATPNPSVPTIAGYGIVWKGKVIPPVSGEYTFHVQSNDRSIIELLVNGQVVYEVLANKTHLGNGKVHLNASDEATIEVRFKHPRSNARCRLEWAVPNNNLPNPQRLLERAQNDGTRIFILENTEEWTEHIARNSRAVFKDKFFVGTNWLGGVMFNKSHPVFNELPADGALNWPYQALIHTGVERMGIVMEGEELLVGAYHTYPMALGTSMGIIPVGKGKVLFSTLDIYGNIVNPSSAGLVAQKLVCNMIDFKSPSLDGFSDGIHHWNLEHKERTYQRFTPDQVHEIASNLMAYQNKDGGWPKNIDWLGVLNTDSVYQKLKESYKRSTLDNRNTFPQIEYLADAYCLYRKPAYKEAALKGLFYLLNTQKENGGWRGWDVDAITFNDDVTTGALELFRNIVQGDKSFAWLNDSVRNKIHAAFERGLKMVLDCQVRQRGVKTAWAQQHDNITLQPVKARTFELPAITANESCEILLFLMGIKNPSPEVVEAIHCGVKWLRQVQIKDVKLKRVPLTPDQIINHEYPYDLVVVKDLKAEPIWARFYEVTNNKPFMCTRSGKKVWRLADVDPERRTGYDWYGYWPKKVFEAYAKFISR